MSLFESIQNRRYDEEELLEKRFTAKEKRKLEDLSSELGTTPGRLTRDVEKGLQAVDKPATQDLDKFSRGGTLSSGSKYNRQAYATGEPFQPDDNPFTTSGKYTASGKSTLKGRLRYPSVETGKPSIDDVKKRLVSRVTQANIEGIGKDPEKAKEFIDKATKNQGPLSKAKGKESTLYKTLKRDLDLREPTVKGAGKPARFVKGKDGVVRQYGGGRLPMPGGYDKNVDGGRTGTKKQQIEYDKRARGRAGKIEGKKQFDAEIRQQAKLPKSVTVGGKTIDLTKQIPSGSPTVIDPKTGKKVRSNQFSRKELNLQFKADKLQQDYGGRFAKRTTSTGVNSPKEIRDKLKRLKRKLDAQNPTITSPKSGGKLPATASNIKKFGLVKQSSKIKTPPKAKKIKTPLFKRVSKFAGRNRGIITGLGIIGATTAIQKGLDWNYKRKMDIKNKNFVPKYKIGSQSTVTQD